MTHKLIKTNTNLNIKILHRIKFKFHKIIIHNPNSKNQNMYSRCI